MTRPVIASSMAAALLLAGCSSLPGNAKSQGTVIGGLGGAAAGAAISGGSPVGGALIGGVLGAGGGYLLGREIDRNDEAEMKAMSDHARQNPAPTSMAYAARTADLDDNGYVTLDEVVALSDAGLTDRRIIRRLEDTDQVFALSPEQEAYLRDAGVSDAVIRALRTINQDPARDYASERISRPR